MKHVILTADDMALYADWRVVTMCSADQLVWTYKLEPFWEHFKKNNTAAGLAYHNTLHTAWMMNTVAVLGEKHKLANLEIKRLVLAAMYHDFCHSGGTLLDIGNIDKAVAGFYASLDADTDKSIVSEDIAAVTRLIQITEYPFKQNPKTVNEAIIRDADILYGCTVHFKKIIYVDLYSELLVSKPALSYVEYLHGQKDFITNADMFTHPGIEHKATFIKKHAIPFWESMGV